MAQRPRARARLRVVPAQRGGHVGVERVGGGRLVPDPVLAEGGRGAPADRRRHALADLERAARPLRRHCLRGRAPGARRRPAHRRARMTSAEYSLASTRGVRPRTRKTCAGTGYARFQVSTKSGPAERASRRSNQRAVGLPAQ